MRSDRARREWYASLVKNLLAIPRSWRIVNIIFGKLGLPDLKRKLNLYSQLLPWAEIRDLTRVSPWPNVISILLLGSLAVALLVGQYQVLEHANWGFLLLPFGVLLMSIVQNALIQLAHEGFHGFLHPWAGMNHFFSVLITLPLGIPFSRSRELHLAHHRNLGGSNDPDRRFYQDYSSDRGYLLREILKSGSGFYVFIRFLSFFRKKEGRNNKSFDSFAGELLVVAVFHLAVLGFLFFLDRKLLLLYCLLWLLPIFTFTRVWQQWRLWIEHGAPFARNNEALDRDPAQNVLRLTQSTIGKNVTRYLVGPFGLNYHVEHHLYSGVPHYYLPTLSRKLRALPRFQQAYQYRDSYL